MPVDPARLNTVGDLVLTEARELRALADPLRLTLFDLVRREGPISSEALAAKADDDTISIDAHLRALTSIGVIEQDGEARWEAAVRGIYFEIPVTPEELRAVQEDLERLLEPFTNRPEGERPGGAAPVRIMAYFMPEPNA
jgi:DNA-binding transcriptional ArsR family regulator